MGSPAGVSSLLTSTDMKSIMFLALFLVAAVFCEAEAEAKASPDAYYGYYGHHGLVHGYGHLGYAHHGYGHLGYQGYGLHYGKREAEPGYGYYGHHGYGHHGYGHIGYHGYGHFYGKREADAEAYHHGYYGHGYGHGYYGHG